MLKGLITQRPWLTTGATFVVGAIVAAGTSIGFAATDRNPTWVEAAAGDTWQSIATAKGLTGSGSGTDGTVSTAGDKLQRANRVGVSTSDTTAFLGGEYLIIPVVEVPSTTTTTEPPAPTTTVFATTTTLPPATTTTQPPVSGVNFLETFSDSYALTSRNGPLNPALYSVSRWRSEYAPSGTTDTQGNGPEIPGDIRINGGLTVETGMQNYGDTLVRVNRPMVGNTLEFDLAVNDVRDGEAEVIISDTPMTIAGFDGDNTNSPKPRNGVRWTAGCFKMQTFSNYVQTNDPVTACAHPMVGNTVNHYTMTFTANSVTVASSDGFSRTWPFTTSGPKWVLIGSHNHATQKYAQLPTFTSRWDNLEFEAGPLVSVAQVQNGTAPTAGVDSFGYELNTSGTTVTTSDAAAGDALLVFNVGIDGYNGATAANWRVNVQMNNGSVQSVPFPLEQHSMEINGNPVIAGNYTFQVPVTAVAGENTIRLSTTGLTTSLPAFFGNVDLVSTSGGTPPPPTTTTTTTTTTQSPETTTTTTLPPATTTTAPPATTTTTTQPPATTTTQPPTGMMFQESFTTPEGFYDRFDFGLSSRNNGDPAVETGHLTTWEGDHNAMCSGPDLRRQIHIHPGMGPVTDQQVDTQTGKSQMWWWCAPGNDPAKGHLMTGTNGLGYMIAWFSPKQTFTNVSKVCWDQNNTTMDAKWTNVVIATVEDIAAVQAQKGLLDLGFDPPGFQDPSGPSTDVVGLNSVGVKVENNWILGYWEGTSFVGDPSIGGFQPNTDKATRNKHCMIDNGNGTVTVTQVGAGVGAPTTRSRTFPGAFPNGQVRVVFEDDMYDPPKRGGYDPTTLTWHWDNIEIS